MSINNVTNVSNAIKYLNGVETTPQKTSILKDAAGSVFNPVQGAFAAWQVSGALKSATGVGKLKELPSAIKKLSTVKKGGTIGRALRSTNLKDQFVHAFNDTIIKSEEATAKNAVKKAINEALGKLTKNATKDTIEKTATKAVEEVVKNTASDAGKSAARALGQEITKKTVEKGVKKGIFSTAKSSISKLGKSVGKLLSKIPGANKVAGAFSKFGGTKVGKFLKGGGAAFTAIMDGGIELFTNVVPAFLKGGFSAGMKQIAKSGTKVAASVGGWVGGQCAATAIGAAIGSVFPGVGTIIGGTIGTAIGGILGSSICNGIASKITGKSEVEKIEEKETEAQAQQIASDSASMQELNALVTQKVQEDIATGNVTEDTEKMAALLESGAFGANTNYTESTPQYQQDTNQNIALNPSYTTNSNYTTYPAANQNNTYNTYNTNWINDAVYRINQGDTSVYNISDEKLNSVFVRPKSVSNSNNNLNGNSASSSSNIFNNGVQQEEVINYFG